MSRVRSENQVREEKAAVPPENGGDFEKWSDINEFRTVDGNHLYLIDEKKEGRCGFPYYTDNDEDR